MTILPEAGAIADAFIAVQGLSASVKRAAASRGVTPGFFWRGDIELHEIALVSATDETPAGYVLVAPDPRLPPIFEYSRSGRPLSTLLVEAIARAYQEVTVERFVFYSSLQIALEVSCRGRLYMVEFPNFRSWEITKPYRAASDPDQHFAPAAMDKLRRNLMEKGPPSPPPAKILTNAAPVKYNQNCNRYTRGCDPPLLGSGTGHCAPNAISGCAPVAWAAWSSSLKSMRFHGAEAIWKSSECWQKPWPTGGATTQQISQCADVNNLIWNVHRLMNTDADGTTQSNRLVDGGRALKDFGVPWNFKQIDKPMYELAVSLIALYGQPFFLSASHKWEESEPNPVGHCVVVYGYDQKHNSVHLCMGWGTDFDDRDINWDQLSQPTIVHLN